MPNLFDQITDQIFKACGKSGSLDVYRALARAALVHASKNQGYRSEADPLRNFHESRTVKSGLHTPAQYAMILCDKQDDALWNLLFTPERYEELGGDPMLHERAIDGIVYRAIVLALMKVT